jgi:cytochrome P450
MMLYYIAREPRIQETLRKQVHEVIHSDSDITNEHLRELTYIDWIQHETTRHFGPVNGQFFRIAV